MRCESRRLESAAARRPRRARSGRTWTPRHRHEENCKRPQGLGIDNRPRGLTNTPAHSPEPLMTYIVTDPCIKCKYMDCVEVCPVDCFYEGENMLVIHPDECIDCGVWAPERPAKSITPDTEPGLERWLKLNA